MELIIGRHPVREAIRAGRKIRRVMIAAGAHGAGLDEVLELASAAGLHIETVARERLESIDPHHQGVVAEAAPYQYAELEEVLAACRAASPGEPPLVLALDSLTDPHNLGSLARTALSAGAAGLILPERRAVGVTQGVGRASAGAVEHLRIVQVVNLGRALDRLKEAGLWVAGLEARASRRYDQADLTMPLCIVIGSESGGLGRLIREKCDILLNLPMAGRLDSLNAAMAGAIVMYEALRQRTVKKEALAGGGEG
ncbi:MAG: 23S rRNA (guanosine(2251)-2'-O)-methyltransferase RlmB [Chloroflexi bacterium]|nr:23S rRNA (guanosine(2251)-2'-O)-methyltransferase RlmB [Chloroflexota bacterium]